MRWLFIAIFMCTSCSSYIATHDATQIQKIKVAAGPEDIQFTKINNKPYLLISCLERREKDKEGDIWLLSLHEKNGKPVKLNRKKEPAELVFRPHGISLVNRKGEKWLYIVNHGMGKVKPIVQKHCILIYKLIYKKGKVSHLQYNNTLYHPTLTNPNDIFALKDGSFYVTNGYGPGFCTILLQNFNLVDRSAIVYYQPANKNCQPKWSQVVEGLEYANGIHVKDDKVLISTSIGKQLLIYERDISSGKLVNGKELKNNMGVADNFSEVNNEILLTSHESTRKFFFHSLSNSFRSPTMVWKIDLTDNQVQLIFRGGKNVNGGSTAIFYNKNLYIAQVFEEYLYKVKMSKE